MEIPTDEKGKKVYEQAPIEATINDIYNDEELDEEEADAYVQARIDGATKRIAQLEKKKPKMGEDIQAFKAEKAKWQANLEAEQASLAYWQGVQESKANGKLRVENGEQSVPSIESGTTTTSETATTTNITPTSETKQDVQKEPQQEETQEEGAFGKIYRQFKGKAKEAFAFLTKMKSGDALGVFTREGIGDIDLVWGDNKGGLAHIIEKHVGKDKSFRSINELAERLTDIIGNGIIDFENGDKVVFKKGTEKVTVRKNLREGGKKIADKNWVLTAYNETSADNGNSAITEVYQGKAAPATDVSADKDTTNFRDLAEKLWRITNFLDNTYGYNLGHETDFYNWVARKLKNKKTIRKWIADKFPPHLVNEVVETIFAYGKAMAKQGTERNDAVADARGLATDAVIASLANSGIEVVEATDAMAEAVLGVNPSVINDSSPKTGEQYPGVELSAKQKRALETVSVQEDEHQQTAISSADGAKVLNNLDNLQKEYEESPKTNEKTFIGEVADALGIEAKEKSSKYARFETKNGKVVTIRLSNHNAKVSNFDNNGEFEGISIVVSAKGNNGITNDGNAHIVEHYYDAIKLRRAEGKPLAEIVRSIKQALYSGEFTDTTGLAERQEVNLNEIEAHIVYHGSGAKFDAFDHSHMGEGEGAQAYGWGTYVTEVEGIGRAYAKAMADKAISEKHRENRIINKLAKETLESRNGNKEEALANLRGLLNESWSDKKRVRNQIKVIETGRNLPEGKAYKRLYTVEIPEDNGSNYLSWDGEISDEIIEGLQTAIETELGEDIMMLANLKHGQSGELLYKKLERALGSDKAASEFLARNGFVGIKYPAQYRSGGRADGASNYVIFNEADAKIVNRVEFLRSPQGVVYGWTDGTKVYLTKDGMNPETPIHEYTHIWAKAMMQGNPEGWQSVKDLLRGTPIWNEVINDPNYSGIIENEDAVASEALSRLSGKENARRMEQEARKMIDEAKGIMAKAEAVTLIERMRKALQEFWSWVGKNLFDIKEFGSIEEVTDRVLYDLIENSELRVESGETATSGTATTSNETTNANELGENLVFDSNKASEFIARAEKRIKEIVERLQMLLPNEDFSLDYIGENGEVYKNYFARNGGAFAKLRSLYGTGYSSERDKEISGLIGELADISHWYYLNRAELNNEDYDATLHNHGFALKAINEFKNSNKSQNEKSNKATKTVNENSIEKQIIGERGADGNLFQYFAGSLSELISRAKASAQGLIKKVIAPVSSRLKNDLAQQGVELDDNYKHVIDNNAIRHTLNNHSGKSEEKRGQIPVTESDFDRITDVVENYDSIAVDNGKRGDINIRYSKTYADGTTIYVEEKRNKRKELAMVTMWKMKNSTLTDANRTETTPISDLSGVSTDKGSDKVGDVQEEGELTVGGVDLNGIKYTSNGRKLIATTRKGHQQIFKLVHDYAVELFGADNVDYEKAKSGSIYMTVDLPNGHYIEIRFASHTPSGYSVGELQADARNYGLHWTSINDYIGAKVDISFNSMKSKDLNSLLDILNGYAQNGFPEDVVETLKANPYNHSDNDISRSIGINLTPFNEAEEGVLFRDGGAFYSNAEEAVLNIKQDKATPEQWLAMIQKNGGLKAGEDKWLGLSEWLTEKGKSKDERGKSLVLTKQEVLEFINQNKIVIEEVNYSTDEALSSVQSEFDELTEVLGGYGEAFDEMANRYGDDFKTAIWYDEVGQLHFEDGYEDYGEYISDYNGINETRLNYTTEGLDNKREIALVVPTVDPYNAHDEIHFGDAGDGRAVAWVRFGETTDAKGNRVLVIDEIQSKRHQDGREKGYRGKDEAQREARIAEIRNRLREITDRMSDISDLIPGAIKGFLNRANYRKTMPENAEYEQLRAESNRLHEELDSLSLKRNAVPDAPFEKNWHELAMKRMLRYAAENGYDKVAWTTGEQQAERYDLSKVVESIDYRMDTDGTILIDTYGSHGYQIESVPTQFKNEAEIAEVFGKEIANTIVLNLNAQQEKVEALNQKLRELKPKMKEVDVDSVEYDNLVLEFGEISRERHEAQKKQTIEGEDLRIGGEGMKGFYDKMLPSFMNKYGKKWGVKVGEVELPDVGDNGLTMHSIDVTDAMRESVMEGQPMFRERDGNPLPVNGTPPKQSSRGELGYSDAEVSMANDPVAKVMGKSQRTKAQQAKFAERERKAMRGKVDELAGKMGIGDRVEVIENETPSPLRGTPPKQGSEGELATPSQNRFSQRKARAKGWFDPKTGKIVINLSNHVSVADVERTLLHEAVAHYGLRELFGEQFDTFLDNVYNNAEGEIKAQIDALASSKGVSTRVATEEYLAGLAEDTNFEYLERQTSFWQKLKQLFMDMLESIGWNYKGPELSDNELRYILWRSYENMVNPGRHRSILGMAEDVVMREKFGVGNFATTDTAQQVAENGEVYSEVPTAEEAVESYKERFSNVGEVKVFDNENALKEYLSQEHNLDKNALDAELDGVKGSPAAYDNIKNKILIFAWKNQNIYFNLIHEHCHKAVNNLGGADSFNELIDELKDIDPKLWKSINRCYDEEVGDEMLAYMVQYVVSADLIPEMQALLSPKAQTQLNEIINYIGYENNTNQQVVERFNTRETESDIKFYQNRIRNIIRRRNEKVGRINGEESTVGKGNEESNGNVESEKSIGSSKGVLFRDGESDGTREEYNKRVRRPNKSKTKANKVGRWGNLSWRLKEAYQDSMLSLKALQEIIAKKYGIEEIPSWMNAYMQENLMSSRNKAANEVYERDFFNPLLEAVKWFTDRNVDREDLVRYMFAKHGLERNRVLAERDAKRTADEAVKDGGDWQKAYNEAYAENRGRDYSGLTALTGEEDVAEAEAIAEQMVEEFEYRFKDSTKELWEKVNAATKETLRKEFEGGLMSREQYEQVQSMFEYYIPLRGWDEEVAEDVYEYLNDSKPLLASNLKTAEGRTSLADDPIATIGLMSNTAIAKANRNKMKQAFYFFVTNNPSDVVSVTEQWYVENVATL